MYPSNVHNELTALDLSHINLDTLMMPQNEPSSHYRNFKHSAYVLSAVHNAIAVSISRAYLKRSPENGHGVPFPFYQSFNMD